MKNQEAYEGEDVILECVVVACPRPELIWYRNNIPLVNSTTNEILVLGDSCKLIMKNVTKNVSGEIKVRAINSLGECLSTAFLNVNPHKRQSVTLESSTQTSDTSIMENESQFYSHYVSDIRSETFPKLVQPPYKVEFAPNNPPPSPTLSTPLRVTPYPHYASHFRTFAKNSIFLILTLP